MADELMQGNALIRSNFNIDPATLNEEQWTRLLCEAVWLEEYRSKNNAKMLSGILGGGD